MSDPRNNVNLAVGIVADPETKEVGGTTLIEFRFALDRAMRDSTTDAVSGYTTAFMNGTHFCSDSFESKFIKGQVENGNLKKGSQILVTGALMFNAYNNKDGVRIERPYIRIAGMAYQGGGSRNNGEGGESKSESGSKPSSPNGATIVNF